MNIFGFNIALAVAWAALTGDITLRGLGVGFVVGSAALFATRPLFPGSERYFSRALRWMILVVIFLWELVVSSIQVVWDVLTPRHKARPGIISVPLDLDDDMAVLVMTNYISLTPGTLCLDVTEDCNTLLIHAMFADDPDAIRRSIKDGVERRIKEAIK